MTDTATGKSGVFSRIDPRARILILLYAGMLSLLLDSYISLTFMGVCCFVSILFSGLSAKKIGWIFLAVVLVTWGTMFSQAIFYFSEPRTVLFHLISEDTPILGWITGEMNVYREGFVYGAVQSLRFSSMMTLGMALCWSTDTRGLMQGLLGMRMPYILSFMTVTALRFLPGIVQEAETVRRAWKVRGLSLFSINPFCMAANWVMFARPMFINGYRKSVILSLSLQSRAFSPVGDHAYKAIPSMTTGTRFFCRLAGIGILGLLTMKIMYWLYLCGLYYHSDLRWVYMICRYYL